MRGTRIAVRAHNGQGSSHPPRTRCSSAGAAPLVVLWLGAVLGAVAACSSGSDAPPPIGAATTEPPEVTDLVVYENVFTKRSDEFPVSDSVAACFTITPHNSRGSLTVVVTPAGAPPASVRGPGVVARADLVPVRPMSMCYPVPVLVKGVPAGEYTLWVLQGITPLAQSSFRAVAPGTAERGPVSAPALAPGLTPPSR